MSHLSLTFLGGFEVTLDGEPITTFGTDKVRALLAYLAIESARPHRRAELAARLWPDVPDTKAAHNLSQTLLRLRRALREPDARTPSPQIPALLLTSQTIQFNPRCDHQLDVARFAELLKARRQHRHTTADSCPVCLQWLHQAVDLYRGDLLAGFFVRDSIAFEEWRIVKQEALLGQMVGALDQLAAEHERREEYDQMQAYARRQTALEPWREEAHLQLMRALALRGQTEAALEQYENFRHTLKQELGVQPSADATALVEQIRSGALKGRKPDRAAMLNGLLERRQVTVVVCSRANPAAHGDPEELYEQFSACEGPCENILTRFDGQRAPRHGGECMIYFGYPTSREDNARRAVDAGLALAAAHASPARIGIHTGLMVASQRRGLGLPGSELVGDVPNLARACHNLAEPGVVLMTADTERLVAGWFDRERRESLTLPGHAASVDVYRAIKASGLPGRIEQIQHLTSLVGREAELTQVMTCLDKVRHGQGQAVLVSGQAGIGKSRLMWEVKTATLAQLSHSPLIWLESRCSPYFQNTSLFPIIRLLEQLLGFEEDDSPDLKREKLVKTLARYDLTHAAAIWHLSLLLGLPDESPIPATITPEQREGMRVACVALLQKQAAEQPLALIIEDLHWSDPSTIEWLDRAFDSLAAAPCLVLLTFRPTFAPAWLPRTSSISLTLSPLSVVQTESMVADLAGVGQLRAEVRQRIVQQADGIPLFVEELTKTLLESDGLDIPATLRDSLMARLDHLGAARETAQWAAALGREFSYPVLSAVTTFDERRLQSDLARLVEAELIVPQSHGTHPHYAFKHALVQEVAQASLLKRSYQAYHRRIAETLEARFTQIAETRPEVIAQHYTEAGMNSQGAECWMHAGERATAQGATLEARTFFDRALALIAPEDHARRWRALLGRETVLHTQGDLEAQARDLKALLELAETFDDDTRRAQAYTRQARYASVQADYQAQLQAAQAAISAARRSGALAVEVEALTFQVTALMRLGDWAAVQQAVQETQPRAQAVADESIRAYALAAVALYYVETGDLGRAIELLAESLSATRQASSRRLDLECQFHGHLGLAYAQLGLYAQAQATLETGVTLADTIGLQRYQAYHKMILGWVYWHRGDTRAALSMEEQALKGFLATGEAYGQAACQSYWGYILEDTGDSRLATEHLTQAHTGFANFGVDPDRFECQAVEARALLTQRQSTAARQLAHEVWAYLHENGAQGISSPSLAYVCLADVFAATEKDEPTGIAQAVLEAGYRDLMQRAEKISHADWRRSLLENVAENRTLIEKWQQSQSARPIGP